jgi:hypothetical protein
MVDDLGTTIVFEHYLCVMFVFQPSFLHISKGVSYDSNNFVSSLLYHIPTTSFQGKQWVVTSSCYCVVGDSLTHNFQETIPTLIITSYVVKIVKQKNDDTHILLRCLDVFASFVFIEPFDSSSDDNLIAPPSTKSPKKFLNWMPSHHNPLTQLAIFNLLFLASVPWQWPGHTSNELQNLDYDKILLQKVQFLPIAMGMFCLNYRWCFQLFTSLCRCKAWIKSMMAMLGAR